MHTLCFLQFPILDTHGGGGEGAREKVNRGRLSYSFNVTYQRLREKLLPSKIYIFILFRWIFMVKN